MSFWRGEDRIAREADAWVAGLHGPERDAIVAELAAWRAADPRHEAAFRRSEMLWQDTGRATRISHTAVPINTRPVAVKVNRIPRFAIAGIVATVAIAGGLYLAELFSPAHLGPYAELRSGAGPETIRLADGSTVWLGADSKVATNFDGTIRAIGLIEGSARFSVVHDAVHPFIVSAAGRTVTARGTIFDVALRPAGLSVTMIEGVVDVGRKEPDGMTQGAIIRLAHGERLVVSGRTERVLEPNPAAATGSSRDYGSTPAARIVADANVGAARPIRFEDPALGVEHVQGRFDLSNTIGVAQQLAAALNLGLVDDSRNLVLVRKAAP